METPPSNCPHCGSCLSDTPTTMTWMCGGILHKGREYPSELCRERVKSQCLELSVKLMNEKVHLVVEAARKFKDSAEQTMEEGSDLMEAAEKELTRLASENRVLRKLLAAELKSEGI